MFVVLLLTCVAAQGIGMGGTEGGEEGEGVALPALISNPKGLVYSSFYIYAYKCIYLSISLPSFSVYRSVFLSLYQFIDTPVYLSACPCNSNSIHIVE